MSVAARASEGVWPRDGALPTTPSLCIVLVGGEARTFSAVLTRARVVSQRSCFGVHLHVVARSIVARSIIT